MLDHLLSLPDLDPELQVVITDVLERAGETDALARLCHLPSLDPVLDARLARIEAAPVRSAWLTRPGRSAEEITAVLASERRVGICSALMAHPLPAGWHARLVDQCQSATVWLAALDSTVTDTLTRSRASGRLAAAWTETRSGTREAVTAAWQADRSLVRPALESVRDLALAASLLRLEPHPGPAASVTVRNVARAASADAVRTCLNHDPDFGTVRHLREICTALAEVVASDACDEDTALEIDASLPAALERLLQSLRNSYHHNVLSPAVAELRRALTSRIAGADADALVAAASGPDCDATALARTVAILSPRVAQRVLAAALANEGLTTAELVTLLAAHPRAAADACADPASLSRHARVAGVLTGASLALPGDAEAIVADLSLAPSRHRRTAVREVFLSAIAPAAVLALPAADVTGALSGDDGELRVIAARIVIDQLDGAPAAAYEQLHGLSWAFAGTFGELLGVCVATTS